MRVRVMTRAAAAGAVTEVRAAAAAADAAAAEVGSGSRAYDGLVAASSVALASAVIEVDAGRLAGITETEGAELEAALRRYGFHLDITRAFKSGSVAKVLP